MDGSIEGSASELVSDSEDYEEEDPKLFAERATAIGHTDDRIDGRDC